MVRSFLHKISRLYKERPKEFWRFTIICVGVEMFALYLLIWRPDWWVESRRYSVFSTWIPPIALPIAYVWGIVTFDYNKK
ncbi:hypothetical protein LX82_03694 [Celeribacter halophilus]|uniref:Uncharacterized protein n=1 Tax=Celeribacter halophilus TaxID=576117 RepID=A0A1I3X7K5_9RHOB|nr:hypothetical protein LX82_03694 [Celeribacter halophilus]SFK15269.1 hypothetical protein SAMN04488138_14110 [Celeribacter halophilus]